MLKYLIIILSMSLAGTTVTAADIENNGAEDSSIKNIQQQLDNFKQSPDAIYAEATLARAQAYLGAAMLADEGEEQQAKQSALHKAQSTLNEAKASAKHFQETFVDLLHLQKSAEDIVRQLPYNTTRPRDSSPNLLLQEAKQALKKVIHAAEIGKLNISQQRAGAARAAFSRVLDSALPTLLEKTANILSSAAAKNAKRYAPNTYEQAKKAFSSLQLYRDGINSQMPQYPAQALELAELALEISIRVKAWRKDKGSHEFLWLQAREQRQKIAASLHIPLFQDDVATAQLIQAIEQLQLRFTQSKQAAQADITALEKKSDVQLKKALKEQDFLLNQQRDEQIARMKEAFRAKLERETFEIKRQKRIQSLFSKGDVSIIANLDGSLVLRLSSLKFSPASSKIDAAYFDLLSRIKNVLDIYGDRTFRIEGHTDDRGDLKGNQKLSLQRAESIRDFLVAAGADSASLKALGYGEVRPIASNDFAKGRDMNRRIDLVIETRNGR
ncbi:MAG: OmpA family protein [Mariprofundaceae bacterium]|nr:OmpA family protein [Mariprofundaceae bacterium]